MTALKIIVTGGAVIGHLNPVLNAGRLLAQAGHEVVAYVPGSVSTRAKPTVTSNFNDAWK